MNSRVLFFGLVLAIGLVDRVHAQPAYSWTISGSSTDPRANSATIVGVGDLYLWFECTNPEVDGISLAEFGVAGTAGLLVADVRQIPPFIVGDTTQQFFAASGCPVGPTLAARITVIGSVAGAVCIVPSFRGNQVAMDCQPIPGVHSFHWTGCSVNGGSVCEDGFGCTFDPISVSGRSWGQVKATYE